MRHGLITVIGFQVLTLLYNSVYASTDDISTGGLMPRASAWEGDK